MVAQVTAGLTVPVQSTACPAAGPPGTAWKQSRSLHTACAVYVASCTGGSAGSAACLLSRCALSLLSSWPTARRTFRTAALPMYRQALAESPALSSSSLCCARMSASCSQSLAELGRLPVSARLSVSGLCENWALRMMSNRWLVLYLFIYSAS